MYAVYTALRSPRHNISVWQVHDAQTCLAHLLPSMLLLLFLHICSLPRLLSEHLRLILNAFFKSHCALQKQ